MIFNLNNVLKQDPKTIYNTISIHHVQIPVSYYVVNNTNNYLSITGGNYTLINGNYNASSFSTMLLAKLGVGWNMSISAVTGIYTLGYTGNFTINSTSTCQRLLGFKVATSISSVSNNLTFLYPCNFLGINRLKVKSNILQTNNVDSNIAGGRCNTLATIPVNNSSGGIINYLNQCNFKTILSNMTINSIDIQVTDENDNLVDFNGIDIYITLQIDTVRQQLSEDNNLLTLLDKYFQNRNTV
jgi:hypothetical protein